MPDVPLTQTQPAFNPALVPVPEPQPLYADLVARYDVTVKDISVGSMSFHMLMVRDTNALLAAVRPEAFGEDERLPYWAELWPSSVELARHCLERDDLKGKVVLELGSGLGLAGIAAARSGAHVIFTDYETDALQFARCNAMTNLPPAVFENRTEFKTLDWRRDTPIERVDMIIGADIVYERRNFQSILDFVRRNLENDGAAIFTDPDRETGMEFLAMAEQQGFDVSVSSHTLERSPKSLTILLAELKPGLRQ